MRLPIIGLIFLALPILEIAGIILVGNAIGLWATLALILGTSILGVVLLRMNALLIANDLRKSASNPQDAPKTVISASMRTLGAILMILPGFITKTLGLAFLIPPLQRLLWTLIGQKITVYSKTSGRANPYRNSQNSGPTYVDLDEDDFHRQPNENSPWKNDQSGDDQKRLD